MEPVHKRTKLNPGSVFYELGMDTWTSDEDSSEASNYFADSDDSTTADELYETQPGQLASPASSFASESDHDCWVEGKAEDSWWAVGPAGPLNYLMRIDFDLLDKLSEYPLSSGESLPNNKGWVLDEGVLFELACDLEGLHKDFAD